MLATVLIVILVILVVGGLVTVGRSLRVIQQYERGLIFRFGEVLAETKGPGLTIIRPVGDRLQKVNMQIIAMAVPAQEGITRDNVSVRVDAVAYFRVVDPIKAVINVQNYMFAVSQQAQTSLRSIIGQSEMDQLLAERETVNRELRRIIDEPTEGPWGIRVERVEIKDVNLPEGMKRPMSAQAEADREMGGVEPPPEIAPPPEGDMADPEIPPLPEADRPGELPPPKSGPSGTTEAA